MWITTKVGFFSATTTKEGQIQVRARVESDLDSLRQAYAPELGPTIATPSADYPYRAFLSLGEWSTVCGRIAEDVDYGNFKAKVAEVQGYDRAHIYATVWSDLLKLESLT